MTASGDKEHARRAAKVLGVPVDRVSCHEASDRICAWAAKNSSRFVLAANVHMTMEAFDDPAFGQVMHEADLVVADGKPLVWALKLRGVSDARHVRGQDLVLAVCEKAQGQGLTVGIYGTTREALRVAERNLLACYPRLSIVFSYAPPFRALSEEEDREIVGAITGSGVQVLLVAIGCPKQEKWMAAHRGELRAVMIGAGAAVDMIGERQPVAPHWMQSCCLEWAFRLGSDPSRLWRRYAKHNTRFAVLAAVEVGASALRMLRARSSRPSG